MATLAPVLYPIMMIITIIMMIVLNTLPDVPHHYVDKGVFYEGEEDEECAGGHEHVNRLKTKDMNMIVKQDIEKIDERKVCREINPNHPRRKRFH